jgi:hypothetical protein
MKWPAARKRRKPGAICEHLEIGENTRRGAGS